MTLEKVVLDLISKGHLIEYRRRTDGGIIVTAIDGQKYSILEGNRKVRQMTGAKLSEARKKQVYYNVRTYIKGSKKPKEKLPTAIKSQLRKIQNLQRKNNINGKITAQKLRKYLKEHGKEQTMDYLLSMEGRAKGYVSKESVDALIIMLERIFDLGELDVKMQERLDKILSKLYQNSRKISGLLYPYLRDSIYSFSNNITNESLNEIERLVSTQIWFVVLVKENTIFLLLI